MKNKDWMIISLIAIGVLLAARRLQSQEQTSTTASSSDNYDYLTEISSGLNIISIFI